MSGRVVVVGSCNLDLIVAVPALPAAGQTVLGGDVVSRPGGKGANQAVAARRLGGDVAFVGAVGDDRFGGILRAALAEEDLDLRQLAATDGPTGVALILVDTAGANQIAVAPGANRRLGREHLAHLGASLEPGSVLLLQLEIRTATAMAAAVAAREAGATVVLNAAPIPARDDADIRRLLDLSDVLVVNEGEALALSGGTRREKQVDWLELAARLRTSGPGAVVITLGAEGAAVAERGETFLLPAFQVDVVDTTGAGDAFCGGLAAALAEGRSLREAVRQGCAAGALATTALGAQTALPRISDLERLYSQAGAA